MVEEIKEKKRRKILVTGASGMLGTDLSRELSRDYDVVGLDIARTDIVCDITDKDKLVKSVINAKPDIVIHAAAWTDVDGCEREPDKARRLNEEGTTNVVSSVAELDIPLVYISTDFVFDGQKKIPYTEDDEPHPLNVYAKFKLEGERKVETLAKYIILRTGWLYGANGKNFVDTIINKSKTKKKIPVVDDQVGCPTYTKHFAKAISKLLARCKYETSEIYHISNKGAVSWFDYAKKILEITGKRNIKVLPLKSGMLDRPAKRPAFSVLDNSKFEKATGLTMRPWEVALEEYLNEKK